ncbi:hypothetical protein PV327_008847 [Microctonus hyperodae]|uniref:Uncharacterized protein n=1 Tax=Microctonus hyperodae TaxID=165561 RepID=A0AA39FSZ1_MICHY|nr:hypothetical protein PV327_008847 [Microctonus hyperodae]
MEKNIYLVGEMYENFVGRKLPTNGEVMSVFLYEHNVHKQTLKESARNTIKKVEEIWSRAGLTICTYKSAIKKLLKLRDKWTKIKKSKNRKKSPTQIKNEALFIKNSAKLFDVAELNLMQKLDGDKKLFLEGQRSDKRYGFIDTHALNKEIDIDDPNQPAAEGSDIQ